jgi:hypothetical protein
MSGYNMLKKYIKNNKRKKEKKKKTSLIQKKIEDPRDPRGLRAR